MKTQPTHTPTPWVNHDCVIGSYYASAEGQPTIGRMLNVEDATFIVRACSNYEGMIELFREIYSENGGTNGKLKGKIEEVFKQAGEVL